ncbi:hypothetical protein [Actinocrispum sp. NPDC049592]|uniref:hypothetical protein n=1 Tax=Actinocrispum sp. NPDC049592 TaxID=3154835 RepID=UPI00341ECC92
MGVELFTWWYEADGYVGLVGEEAFRDHVVDLLCRASRRDCAAAGLGCARRVDRACPQPAVCGQDPRADMRGADRERGPVPGACGTFHGYWRDVGLRVFFSDDDRHRAVFWRTGNNPPGLWVNGNQVHADVTIESWGYWVGDRFFVVSAEGPAGHPEQVYGPGELVTKIVSLLIFDAHHASSQLLVPRSTENWETPRVVLHETALSVYANRDACTAGKADRVLPVEPIGT